MYCTNLVINLLNAILNNSLPKMRIMTYLWVKLMAFPTMTFSTKKNTLHTDKQYFHKGRQTKDVVSSLQGYVLILEVYIVQLHKNGLSGCYALA